MDDRNINYNSSNDAVLTATGKSKKPGPKKIILRERICLPHLQVPGPFDVICDRGKDALDHVGNKWLRELARRHLCSYANATTKTEKSSIMSKIVACVRSASAQGGFIKKDKKTGRWWEVGDLAAREKVGLIFRDALCGMYKSNNRYKYLKRKGIELDPEVETAKLRAFDQNGTSTDVLVDGPLHSLGYGVLSTIENKGGDHSDTANDETFTPSQDRDNSPGLENRDYLSRQSSASTMPSNTVPALSMACDSQVVVEHHSPCNNFSPRHELSPTNPSKCVEQQQKTDFTGQLATIQLNNIETTNTRQILNLHNQEGVFPPCIPQFQPLERPLTLFLPTIVNISGIGNLLTPLGSHHQPLPAQAFVVDNASVLFQQNNCIARGKFEDPTYVRFETNSEKSFEEYKPSIDEQEMFRTEERVNLNETSGNSHRIDMALAEVMDDVLAPADPLALRYFSEQRLIKLLEPFQNAYSSRLEEQVN